MATQKTVNITSGKVLNYTITAAGYKTMTGSKLITEDTTININLVPEESEDNIFVLGDRIGDCATFVDYFDSVDPNTQENDKLAVFVLDAKYRYQSTNNDSSGYDSNCNNWGYSGSLTGMPYSSDTNTTLAMKHSATYATQFMYDNFNVTTDNYYLAWRKARNAKSIEIIDANGDTRVYSSQLPTLWQLSRIFANKNQLDTFDPTLVNYPRMSLSDWLFGQTYSSTLGGAISCNEYSSDTCWCYGRNASNAAEIFTSNKPAYNQYRKAVVPVFEIPVRIFQASEESGL